MNYREGKARFDTAYARPIEGLVESEWGLPAFANKETSIPLVFELFQTYPTVNRNRMAITYPTAINSIDTLAYQYLNKDHVMLGTPLDKEGKFRADRDTVLGTVLASRFADQPEGEPTVFIEKPVKAQVLGVLWPLTEFGGETVQKMRNAIAQGEKMKIGASFEIWYRDIGFIWMNKIYQRGVSETEEDLMVLDGIENTLAISADGMLFISAPYGGQWPTLLLGGANGVVLFHGAAIIVDEDPAYPDTSGQFQIFAKRTENYLQAVCKAGAEAAPEVPMKELEEALAKMRVDLLAEIKQIFATANPAAPETPDLTQALEAANAKTDTVVAAVIEKMTAKFEEALTAAKAEAETAIRAQVTAEAQAVAAVLEFATKNKVEVKAKAEIKENERAFAREDVEAWVKTPTQALSLAKAATFDMPLTPNRPANASKTPAGNPGSGTEAPKTIREIKNEMGVS